MGTVTVRATNRCWVGKRLRQEGDVFNVNENDFTASCMVAEPPPVPPVEVEGGVSTRPVIQAVADEKPSGEPSVPDVIPPKKILKDMRKDILFELALRAGKWKKDDLQEMKRPELIELLAQEVKKDR